MKKLIAIALLGTVTTFTAACTSASNSNTNTTNTATTNSSTHNDAGAASADVPAAVKTAIPDAQSFTMQHKNLTAEQVAAVERDTNTKIKDKDHHSYLAISTAGGTRRQIGAATIVDANGKQMVVVYESREGVPYIKEVRAEGVAQGFLDQFKGKGHDNKLQIGNDLKTNGADDATARAAADAIRQDAVIMQTLYGGAHGH